MKLATATFPAPLLVLFFVFNAGFGQSTIDMAQVGEYRPSAEFRNYYRGPWSAASFSPDGRSLATSGDTAIKTIWDIESGQPRHLLQESGPMAALAFHPNSRWIAFVARDAKTIRLWDAIGGSEIRNLHGNGEAVLALAFLGDGGQLASMALDGKLTVWESATGRELKRMQLDRAAGAMFSVDGSLLATKTPDDYSTKLWTVSSGRLLRVLPASLNLDRVMAFSPDGMLLADAGPRYEHQGQNEVNAIRIYEVNTGQERYKIPLRSNDYQLQSLAFSSNGRWLTLAGSAEVLLWEVNTGRQAFRFADQSLQKAVTFSPDSQWLVISSGSGVKLCNIAAWQKLPDGKTALALRTDDANGIQSLAFRNDDRKIATESADGVVRLWDVTSRQVVRTMSGQLGLAAKIEFSHDGKMLAGYDSGNTISLWDPESGELQHRCKISSSVAVISAWAFSPDDRLLVVGDRGKAVLFDVATCAEVRTLAPVVDPNDTTKAPKPGYVFDAVDHLAFSPDGRRLALVVTNSLQLWDVNTGRKLAEVIAGPAGKAAYRLPAFSADGHSLAVVKDSPNRDSRGAYDIQLIVYDAASLHEQYNAPLPGMIDALSFNSDGNILLDANRVTEVREIATGKVLQSRQIPEGPLGTRVFSNDGQWLATVGAGDKTDDSILLWDLSTGERAATLAGMPVRSFSWEPTSYFPLRTNNSQ